NRVTCRDWFQLSLKEGLTVFRDQQFGMDVHSRGVTRIQEVRTLRTAQFPEDAGPMAHPIRPASYAEINNFYTATVYEKGAEVIRMIHTLIGAAAFRKGMDLYFARHDGQAVTCEEFVAAMQDASGLDLTQFQRWYNQAGTPKLVVRGEYDAAARRFTLSVEQHYPP
ncbi:MAG TPA: M1 family aminopeptidase, partial [Rhodocyclaceae bacterium]|nr:M1 family aminopeptidase [Rhodocyclaceae bacterium]